MQKILLIIRHVLLLSFTKATIIPFQEGFYHRDRQFIHHSHIPHNESAFYKLSSIQTILVVCLLIIFFGGAYYNLYSSLRYALSILTVFYFSDLVFNLILIIRSLTKDCEIKISKEEITQLKDHLLPSYTVLCPLYREKQILPQFITAMNRLDYPKEKLQIILLLEEDDFETISETKNYNLPSYFQINIIAHSIPKTKPKAINFGLKQATGKYIVVYDAEDIPEEDQLKKVIIAFDKAKKEIICFQAKLSFYNPRQNILTRIFTAEYSLWFDLILSGLHSFGGLIPLGGTSNHFKTDFLKKIGGWDAFNVTEDCDLGIRLVKKGYQTAMFDSVTYEEANSNLKNWFKQRTRWIKGYIQTYFVHMRNPITLINKWKKLHILTLQLVVGGKVLSMFINQLLWIITFGYFIFRPLFGTTIESLFPFPFFYLAVFSLIFGNFLYIYYYMLGCAKRGDDDLIKYVFLVPFYWLGMSLSAWVAVYQLVTKPFFWEKTHHGLHLKQSKSIKQAKIVLGHDLIDVSLVGIPNTQIE